jgi:hypothetical protein
MATPIRLASQKFRSVFQGEGEEFFVFTVLYAGEFQRFEKSGKIVKCLPAGERFPLRKQNEEERR